MFLWTLQCSFDTPVVLSFAAVNFFFGSNFNKGQKCTHFSRITFIIFPRSVFWTRELHFWQRRRNKSLNSKLFSTQSSKLVEKNLLFQKKFLSLRMIHVTHGMQYWRHVENFWWFQSFTCSNLEKEKKTVKGKKNKLSSKSSSGLAEYSFDDRALIFSLKSPKSKVLPLKFKNRWKKVKYFSLRQILLEWLIWTHNKKFWQISHNKSGNRPKCLNQNRKCSKKVMNFWKNCIFGKKFQRTRELDFWQSCRNFKTKIRKLDFQGPHSWREK